MDELITFENENLQLIYDNHINQIHFKGFNKKDMDLFMVICKGLMDKNTLQITIPYREIKRLANYQGMSRVEFNKQVKNLDRKFFALLVAFDDIENEEYSSKPLFDDYCANGRKQELTISINKKALKYFNVFEQYTKVDLLIHTSLKGKYSAILYRVLCQFSKNKWWKVSLDYFKEIFDVPEKYDVRKIKQKIIEPAIEELKPYMNIKYTPVKSNGKGRPIIGYEFSYTLTKTVTDKKENEQLSGQIEFVDTAGFDEIVMDMQETTSHSDIDYVVDLIDSYNLGIGSKSTINIAKKAYELNRDEKYIRGAIEVAKSQKCNNLGGKIMKFIIDGYADSVKKEKKTGFNNFESRKYDYDDLEKKLLGWD